MTSEVGTLFSSLETIWRTKDFARMRSQWLSNLEAPLYLAEEHRSFITTWPGFDDYFRKTAEVIREITARYRVVAVLPAAAGQNLVAFELDWSAAIDPEPPVAGSVRGVAFVELEHDEWKLRAYVEAPLAPIVYMGELYQLVARTRGIPGS